MDLVAAENKSEEKSLIEIQALEIFKRKVIDNESVKDLAKEYNLSLPTIYSRIDKGRELYLEPVLKDKDSKNALSDVLLEYEWLAQKLKEHYRSTNDLNALKEYRALIGDRRKLFSLDAPPKAAVNKDGETVDNKLILVINDAAYKQKETEQGYIEGEVKEVGT